MNKSILRRFAVHAACCLFLGLSLPHCAAQGLTNDTQTFPDIRYPKPPNRVSKTAASVLELASQLKRLCPLQSTVVWNSSRPADELKSISNATMSQLKAFDAVTEEVGVSGRPLASGQRLFFAKLHEGGYPFTFLWIAGKDTVSLEICGDQNRFNRCAQATQRSDRPLDVCPPLMDM